mmetsp:Transcript_20526/g.37588  ORF Transcript_20526/g.37588 Transcript_20526/m.37588 type:complete len:84 (+) Transcript_20526:94-345(+)
MATNIPDYVSVKKIFGDRSTIGSDELIRVLKEIAPALFADEGTGKLLLERAGCCGDQAEVDAFFALGVQCPTNGDLPLPPWRD